VTQVSGRNGHLARAVIDIPMAAVRLRIPS
jgi:hypothetical protein